MMTSRAAPTGSSECHQSFALLHLPSVSDRDKDVEVLALRHREYLTCVTFSHDEDVVENLTADASDDPFAMRVHPAASPRCRIDARAVQHVPDRRGADAMIKPNQFAMNPSMSPPRIFPGKSEYERPDRRLG